MRKQMTFEHLDKGTILKVIFEVDLEGNHWRARLAPQETGESALQSPVFYGSTADQAERQLRKVFDREYELRGEETLS